METLNRADSLIYELEKQLRDNEGKLSAEDKATVETEIAAFKKVREGNDAEQIKEAIEPLTQKVYQIFGKLYQQEGGAPDMGSAPDMGGSADGTTQNDDGTVNTDFDVK